MGKWNEELFRMVLDIRTASASRMRRASTRLVALKRLFEEQQTHTMKMSPKTALIATEVSQGTAKSEVNSAVTAAATDFTGVIESVHYLQLWQACRKKLFQMFSVRK